MKTLFFFLVFLSQIVNSASIEGVWYTDSNEAKVKVYKCEDAYCGDIIWLKEPNWNEKDVKDNKGAVLGEPKVDLKNDDESLRSRPVIGMTLLTKLKKTEDNEWGNGKIYDAESGNTYSCQAKINQQGDTLKMKGYIGVSWLGRTTTWTRE